MIYFDDDYDRYDPSDDYDQYDPSGDVWCSCCHKPTIGVTVDYGIGEYEYWGRVEVHHDYEVVSACCEEELLDFDPEEE